MASTGSHVLYTGAKTVVRTVFDIKVGMHQDSALSPLLFVIVMEALSRELFMQLVSKIFNLCGPDLPTSQRDGQTDRRHAIARPPFAL